METKTKLILNEITKEFEYRIDSLIKICESPIEEYFLIELIRYFYSQSLMSLEFKFLAHSVDWPKSSEPWNYQETGIDVFGFIYGVQIKPSSGIVYRIIPQYKHSPYRLDFAIFVETPNSNEKFCIECDGHEFHKTKADTLNDSKRARELAREGWVTLRYTGSELFKSNSDML